MTSGERSTASWADDARTTLRGRHGYPTRSVPRERAGLPLASHPHNGLYSEILSVADLDPLGEDVVS